MARCYGQGVTRGAQAGAISKVDLLVQVTLVVEAGQAFRVDLELPLGLSGQTEESQRR